MLNKHWNVLVVDDEPDVLAVTRLALKRMTCFGLPINLHELKSKAETIEFLTTKPEGTRLPIVMVDVVMESDTAGLEICDFIRKEMKNNNTRIIVRTGQAGKAPERDVIDRYDITGYLPKTEATDDRLYSTVKGCIREFYPSVIGTVMQNVLGALVRAQSVDELSKLHKRALQAFYTTKDGRQIEAMEKNFSWHFKDHHVGTSKFEDVKLANETRDRLLKVAGQQLSEAGDTIHYADGTAMLNIAPAGAFAGAQFLWTAHAWPPPNFALQGMLGLQLATRPLWVLATTR